MDQPPAALVFDVQRFCLHDGPGVRTTVFLKGCPLSCAWCQNPEGVSPSPQVMFYVERCAGCGACFSVCPEGAVLEEAERRVDFSRCTGCGACAAACVHGALVLAGRKVSPEGLLAEVLADKDFFRASGGGVTLSGGEPMAQAGFLDAFLPLANEAGLSLVLETSGACPGEDLARLAPYFDLVYYDIKFMDPGEHRRWVGVSNERILENFENLAGHPGLVARMPVVPGVQDAPDNLAALAAFLKRTGHKKIHLLPYHPLGRAKLSHMAPGRAGTGTFSGDPAKSLASAREALAALGLRPVVYQPL
ncbi:MAG: glycyl-radical enzyme activating protein [Deltaproteobacteria bacterium]|nr:glycyl-radical enzyme activating protein [Deltaproteobacteria bacterium]